MTFNSLQFALFLPLVLGVHWRLRGRARIAWLLAASYLFYGVWDYRFLGLLILTTGVDYSVARAISSTDDDKRRRRFLVLSIAVNLLVLGTFKYFNFFIDSAAGLLGHIGLEPNRPFLRLTLPIGVSFYTFQSIAYVIDVSRRRVDACKDLLLYATFVAYFPQLVAGPISRARALLPQLAGERAPPSAERALSGLGLIALGLVKKVVIADQLAPIVRSAFDAPRGAGSGTLLLGVFAFALQIYGDFSGYTDIARGSSRLLSVELMENFRAPYLARSITEFWQRWHISLSTWLRDFLYIPLGGNRRGRARTYVNLLITMLLGGLWHGAAWTFVVWGGFHGALLGAHRAMRRRSAAAPGRLPALIATVGTFLLVCVGWAFFRAQSLRDALAVLWGIVRVQGSRPPTADIFFVALCTVTILAIDRARANPQLGAWACARPLRSGALLGIALVAVVITSGLTPVPFIYFQF